MNWSDAVEILKNFRNQRVLVTGGVTLDRHSRRYSYSDVQIAERLQ